MNNYDHQLLILMAKLIKLKQKSIRIPNKDGSVLLRDFIADRLYGPSGYFMRKEH